MKKRNAWNNVSEPLEMHKDDRGTIADIFYKGSIEHVAIIKSNPGSIRGNHYHEESTQHMLITKGSLEYWYKQLDSDDKPQCVVLCEGDIVSTPPFEVHALKIIDENEFIVFSEGMRGGRDYESDTIRINENIIGDLQNG
jgi:dTDP-4-dehydrorhamnose 3,5-epimerase-like enzyme